MANLHNKWLHKNIVSIMIPAIQDMGFEWKKQGTAKEVGRQCSAMTIAAICLSSGSRWG
jgi:hypothetical protein